MTDSFSFQERQKSGARNFKNFLKINWEFPCVGAWDGFHVYISTTVKNFYSYKKRYSVTNMGFT